MGTFHHDKGEYHGITIVVDTPGPTAYIGRCDTFTADGVILLDADVYEPGADRPSKEAWIAKAAKVGIWKKLTGSSSRTPRSRAFNAWERWRRSSGAPDRRGCPRSGAT